MKPKNECYSMNPEIIEWVKEYAKKTRRSKSAIVDIALTRYRNLVENKKMDEVE